MPEKPLLCDMQSQQALLTKDVSWKSDHPTSLIPLLTSTARIALGVDLAVRANISDKQLLQLPSPFGCGGPSGVTNEQNLAVFYLPKATPS